MPNRIHNIETRIAERDTGPLPTILIGLDIHDLGDVPSFIHEVVEKFITQRMISPPETAGIFVTLVGGLSAHEFKQLWTAQAASNPVLKFFMDQMTEASVLHGKPGGEVISHISLR